MCEREDKLVLLGKWVSQRVPAPSPEVVREEREAFLMHVLEASSARRSRSWGLAAAAVAAALVAAVGLWWFSQPSSVSTSVSAPQPVPLAYRVVVSQDGGKDVVFQQGSRFRFDPGSRGAVVAATSEEVRVALTEGTVRCTVHKQDGTRWVVAAGDYQVRVTGTAFTVTRTGDRMRVAVTRGAVKVFGGRRLARRDLTVEAGHVLEVDAHSLVLHAADEEPDTEPAVGRAPAHRRSHRAVRAKRSVADANAQAADWLSTADVHTLWRAARSARIAGRFDEAQAALSSLRARFPSSPYAAQALFVLGKIAQEAKGDAAAARTWYERYLREAPTGALAPDALGRLVQVCRRLGAPCATTYARRYLERYPTGPFAPVAHSVVH